MEDGTLSEATLNPEETSAVEHFKANQTRAKDVRFLVPLPKRENAKPLGECRSQAVHQFLSLERNLHSRNHFQEFGAVMEEYFELGNAEVVPREDLDKPPHEVFYSPMHVVHKDSSTTTKVRAVFDASMVGPTIHSSLIDVLIRFRF